MLRRRGKRVLWLIVLSSALLGLQSLEAQQSGWFSFPMPWDDGTPSFISFENSGPITQPIRVGSDGHLHLGSPSGPRVRLFGVGITGEAAFPSHTQAEKVAGRLRKLGFNFVRFHIIDSLVTSLNPVTFDSSRLDRLLYFISQLKNQGIYVGILLPGNWVAGLQFSWERPSALFDPSQIQKQKEIARKLLVETINTYTGMPLSMDPVLAYVQFNNEITLFNTFQTCNLDPDPGCNTLAPQALSPEEDQILNEKWNQKLLAFYGNRSNLQSAWAAGCTSGRISLEPDEDPAQGTVKRIEFRYRRSDGSSVGSWELYCPKRLIDELTFYYQVEKEYVQEMFNYLRFTLGLEIPITTVENFIGGMANKMIQATTNALGQHAQWVHPLFFTGGFMDPPLQFINWPMVKGPVDPSVLTSLWPSWVERRNTIWRIAISSAVQGKPLLVTEYNHGLPNEFQAEFPMIIAAYAAFQGWDAVVLHEYGNSYSTSAQGGLGIVSSRRWRLQPLAPGLVGSGMIEQGFELADNPAVMAQIPAAARLFRYGWVQEGSEASAIEVPFWEDGVFNGQSGALNDWWKCLSDWYCYWENTNLDNPKNINPAWSLVRKLRMKFTSGPEPVPNPGTPPHPYVSETGELRWDMTQGLLTINSPYVQGAIGYVNSSPIQLSTLRIQATTDFAAIHLVPLDNLPITSSQKLLLTAAGRVANTNMNPAPPRTLAEHTLQSWGTGPVILQPIQAQITLSLPSSVYTIRVYKLDERGNPTTEIPVQKSGSNFTFSIGSHNTLWYGIIVEPIQTPAVFRITRQGDVLTDGAFFSGNADIAEYIDSLEPLEPGDVVELDPHNPRHYRRSRSPYSTLVAGVISAQPGFILGSREPARPLLALVGRVHVKASAENGPIRPGDLLVSASKPGYAMRCPEPVQCEGAILGKALEPLEQGTGTILILLAR
jgi:hypothetical protein